MKKLILFLFVLGTLCSCKQYRQFDYEHLNLVVVKKKKWEKCKRKKTIFYKVEEPNILLDYGTKSKIGVYELDSNTIANVAVKDSFLKIKPAHDNLKPVRTIIVKNKNYPQEDYFYPLLDTTVINNTFSKNLFKSKLFRASKSMIRESEKFKYKDRRLVLQALSIPLRVRFDGDDTTRYTPYSPVNVSLAAGLKIRTLKYRNFHHADNGKFINSHTKEHSFSFGVFLGPTVIELTQDNTGGSISSDRSSIGLTTGIFTVWGVQKFNLGFGFGVDLALGEEEWAWKHTGKPWYGLVIGFSFI